MFVVLVVAVIFPRRKFGIFELEGNLIFLQLELAKQAGKSHKELSPIFVSLAITYLDLKCPADAINCYMEELGIMEEGNYKEVCRYFYVSVILIEADGWCFASLF